MSTQVEIASARLQNASVAFEAAKSVGLPYFVACALLDMESEGKNFFGSDAGGMYKGEAVTKTKFEAMEKAVAAGGPSNGVGPTQITHRSFFPQARAQGLKLWISYDNMIFGFKLLKSYLDRYPGDYQKAGRLYNGKDSYGNTFARVVGEWKERLSGASNEEAPVAAWHLADSLVKFQKDLDAEFGADRPNDGTIGDAAHAARESEHNPDDDADTMPKGAVSAIDVYTEAKGKTWITDAEFKKLLAVLKKDARVWYVIHKEKIYSRTNGFVAKDYDGSNPHNTHIHLSLVQTKAAHDSVASWKLTGIKGTPSVPVVKLVKLDPNVKPGKRHAQVIFLKRLLKAAGYATGFSAGDLASNYYGQGAQQAVNRFHKLNGKFASTGAYDPAIGPLGFAELQRQAPNVSGK